MAKNYYVVLGIPHTESARGIRSAFRDLARRHHPDRAGPEGTPVFREVVEAYEVLSDPRRRQEHDARLREPAPPRPLRRRRGPLDPRAIFGVPESIQPSADALRDRLLRNFSGPGLSKGEHAEPLLCDVALSPHEALRGGTLPIRIPTLAPCARCHGAGHVAGFACPPCDAAGHIRGEIVVPLEVPARIRSGTILELPLSVWGVDNVWLRARIRVAR